MKSACARRRGNPRHFHSRFNLTGAVAGVLTLACLATACASPSSQPEATAAITASATPETLEVRDFPVLPQISDRAREIFRDGVERGRNNAVFSKVGDCLTASENFLGPFSAGDYDLGEYEALQATIAHYAAVTVREVDGQQLDSFSNPGLAATSGFTSAAPLDHIWADPAWCEDGETPLDCEYRISNPSLSLIMFGTNDVQFLTVDQFDAYMRQIVEQTIDAGILPVLVTFPPQPGRLAESEAFNQIIVHIASDYETPLINLWLALAETEGYGVDPEHPTRLTIPADGCTACFTAEHLQSGITVQNLVVLQALDALRLALID